MSELISISEIKDAIEAAELIDEPDVPFPQANSIQRMLDSLSIIQKEVKVTSKKLAKELGVEPRQGSYYGDACTYLRLTTKNKYGSSISYGLSPEGEILLNLQYKERVLKLICLIAQHEVFNHFLKRYLDSHRCPTKEEIVDWLAHNTLKENELSTVRRRSSTVLSWINWIVELSK